MKWITPEEEEEKMKQTLIDFCLQEVLEQGKIEIAKKMLEEKCDIEFISKITGLSIKEINEISE